MKFYMWVVSIGLSIIVGVNLLFEFTLARIGNIFLFISYSCLPSVIIMFIVRFLPKGLFKHDNIIFKEYKFESRLYKKLGVKKWKEKIPEAGRIGGFRKDKIEQPKNKQYINKFLSETCVAEMIHSLSAIWGFVCLLFIPKAYFFSIGLPIALLNGYLHYLPILIQRYMRPRLVRLADRLPEEEEMQEINT